MPRTAISPSLCFTHDFLDLYETIAQEPSVIFEQLLDERPLVLLTRDLRDLAISSFYYLRSSQPKAFARLVPSGSLAEYVDSPIVGIERLARLPVVARTRKVERTRDLAFAIGAVGRRQLSCQFHFLRCG